MSLLCLQTIHFLKQLPAYFFLVLVVSTTVSALSDYVQLIQKHNSRRIHPGPLEELFDLGPTVTNPLRLDICC